MILNIFEFHYVSLIHFVALMFSVYIARFNQYCSALNHYEVESAMNRASDLILVILRERFGHQLHIHRTRDS